MDSSWIPVTNPKDFHSSRDINKLEVNMYNESLPFLSVGDDSKSHSNHEEPVEVIIFRVIFALLISISLVVNLLLFLAILRIKCRVAVVYMMLSFMIVPDIMFYIKLITELIHWDTDNPTWASSDWSCGLWQFSTHLYPIMYSFLLVSVMFHAMITLYMDYKGDYEKRCRKYLPLILIAVSLFLSVICSSSGFYSRAKINNVSKTVLEAKNVDVRQYCDLIVPSIVGPDSKQILDVSVVTYRLVYEIVLPYMVPLLMVGFPYVSLLVGQYFVPQLTNDDDGCRITLLF